MSQAKAIEDMNFKELRQEVRRLSDKLARMERGYADTLENLDDDNFSAQTLKEKEKIKTDIRHTKEGLEIVTKEVYPDGTEAESAIEINANHIATKVSKTLNFGEAIRDTVRPNRGGDPDKLYFWETDDEDDKGYYYYSDVSEAWVKVDGTSIYSAFIQTVDGFKLHGNVRISGDLITEGTIKGIVIQTHPTNYNDCVRLNGKTNRLEVVYGGSVVGYWELADAGSAIGGHIFANGTWDFTNATVKFNSSKVSGLQEGV